MAPSAPPAPIIVWSSSINKSVFESSSRADKHKFREFISVLESIKESDKDNKVKAALDNVNIDERKLLRIEAMITSMTPAERSEPSILNSSRKKRIADGAGVKVQDVNMFLKQFDQMRKMMKQFSNPKKMKRAFGGFGNLFK